MYAFFQLWSFENYNSKFKPHLRYKISCSFSPPSPHLLLLQALIHGFLWWWACVWLIFSLKWRLQSFFFFLHSATMIFKNQRTPLMNRIQGLQAPHRSYIIWYQEHLHLGDVLLLPLSFFFWSIYFNSLFFILFSMYILHCLVVWYCLE